MKTTVTSLRSLATALLALVAFTHLVQAQTYFTESFESAFSGTPAAPPGWTQTRVRLLGGVVPAATNVDGPKDWARNTWSGTAWAVSAFTPSTDPGAPPAGSAALWMEDSYFGSTGTFFGSRRMESPVIDLSSSTSPYIRFRYAYGAVTSTGLNFRVLVSADGGSTWQMLSAIPGPGAVGWFKMTLWIPPAYRTANFRLAFEMTNTWGTSNLFVDDVRVEEFTPTTITSAASGTWNTPATWVGGVVPDADNHVVIAAGHTVSSNGNMDRCQNLTVNGTFQYASTTATQLIQILGNLTVNAGGTYHSHSGTTGKRTYLNGNLTVNAGGTLNFSSTGAHLILFGAHPATYSNAGTLTAGHLRNCWFVNTAGVTINSALTISQTLSLVEGPVNPNGFLTVGNSTVATTQTLERAYGSFTVAPIWGTGVTRSQSYLSGGSVNFIPIRFINLVPGEEVPLFSGVRTIQGTMTMNTWGNVELNYPLTVGTATSGGLTLTRGIIKTTATNLLTLSPFIAGPVGTAPSTTTFPTTHGSYVAGPLRIQFPTSGTANRTFPVGVGSDFIGVTPNANRLRTVTIATTTPWSGQDITVSLLGPPSGPVNAPLSTTMGLNVVRVQLNGASPDLPATATISFAGNNYTVAYSASSDNMIGTQGQLAIAQATTPTGTWTIRSALSGSGAFSDNTNYSRIATSVAPLATNGEYFCLATTLPSVDDWSVVQLYTLGKTALSFGDNHVVKAYVRNLGTFPGTKTVTLNVTGANTFTNTQSVTLKPGQWTVVSFAPYTNTATGTNTVTVSLPADDVTANDSRSYTQVVTTNLMSYKEPSLPNDGGVGYTGTTGDFVAKFTTATVATIDEVKVDFHSSGTPQPYKLGIWDDDGPGGTPGTLLHETTTLTSTPGSTAFVPITPPVSVSGGFFVGVRQIGTTNVAFGYQSENPIRQDGFYFAPGTGSGLWADFAMPPSPFRFSIEPQFFVPTPPNCATAFNPPDAATGVCSGGTLSWASGGGGPTGYRIYFGTSPTPPLVDSTTGTTWTLPALTPATTYYWQIVPYNAYGYATGCSVLSFTSHASPSPCVCNTYCTAGQISGSCIGGDEYISSVTFNTLSNSSTCAGSLPSGYTNYTSGPTTTVLRGVAYTLTVVNPNPFTGDQGRAFFDWNQDGDFDDAGETYTLTTADYSTFTASITIPLTSTLGTTRMRCRVYFTGATPACGNVSFGEAEDYCITIADPPPCSGTPAPGSTTASPTYGCTGSPITLGLTGSLTETGYTYNWQVSTDGGATWTTFSTSAPPVTYTYGTAPVTQLRCVVTCTHSGLSANSTPVTVTLGGVCECSPYCTPPNTDCTDDDIITNVTLGTLLSNTTTCGNPTTGFTLYTSPNPILVLGNSYSLSVTTSAAWSQGLRVWFDWNGDGDFADAGEEVAFASNYLGTAPATYTATVTVPLTATLGSTRMRARCRFTAAPPTDPCAGGFTFGETEDYCITIAPPTCTWTGAVPAGPVWGSWHVAGNWDCGYVPTITTDVVIPNTAPVMPAIVNADGNARNVTMQNGTQIFIVSSSRRLNVANDWSAGTGTGAAVNYGPGSVRMLASDGLGQMTGNTGFHTLDIHAGTGTVTITSGSVRVRNAVQLRSGTLNTLGNLTLESLLSPAHTAGIIDNFSPGFTGTMVGNVKAERRIPRWNPIFFGSPVNNGTVADIAADVPGGLAHNGIGGDGSNFVADPTCTYMSPSSPWARLMQYDESTVTTCAFNGWQIRLSGTTQNGRGYMLHQVTASVHPTYDFTGIANTGAITANVTRTAANTTANQGVNLLSNPYPSGINLDAFYAANSGVIGTMAYLYNGSTFVTVNMNDGVPSNVASFQGFQVVKSAVGTGTVTFNQSMRVVGNTLAFTDAMAVPHKLEVVVTGRDAEHRDETVVYFGEGLKDGFDLAEDGYKFYSAEGYPTLYTMAEGTAWPVSVNGLNVQTAVTEVPLGLSPGAAGRFVFTVRGGDRLPAGMTCYLVDKLEKKEVKVGEETSYVFDINGVETRERFVLRFRRDVPVEVQPVVQQPQREVKSEEVGVEADRAWTQNNRIYLLLGRDVPGRLTLRLMDMSGKVVWTDALQNAVRGVYDLGELEVSSGLYILNWSDGRSTQSARLALGLSK